MEFYHCERISPRITAIHARTSEIVYLLTGDERAALIDTGVGYPGLKELVQRLTSLPLTVLLTHGHVDHAMGAGAFDAVYMSPLDKETFREHCAPAVRNEYLHAAPDGSTANLDASILPAPPDCERFLPLLPGQRFSLGGLSLTALDAAGHTPGSTAFLIPEERLLITGDGCNPFTLLFHLPVSAYLASMERLNERTQGCYDSVLLTHRVAIGSTDMIPSMIRTCRRVLEGRTDDIPMTVFGRSMYLAMAVTDGARRADGEPANLVYAKDRL